MPETHDSASAFDLPERLRRKADPALIAGDEARFAAIGAALAAEIARTSARLDALRRRLATLTAVEIDREPPSPTPDAADADAANARPAMALSPDA